MAVLFFGEHHTMARKRIDITQLTILAPHRRQRKPLIAATATIFRPGEPDKWEKFCREGYLDGSCYDWDTSRIAVLDGRIVAHIGVWGHVRRIGRARLRSVGIGTVATLAECRGSGVGRLITESALDATVAAGYDISVMAGIPGFYTRFGWVPSKPHCRTEIKTDDLPDDSPVWKRRRASLTKMIRAEGAVGRIYNREQADVSCAAVRPLFTKDHRHWQFCQLCDTRGRVRGYMATQVKDQTLVVHELGGFSTPAGRAELLRQLRDVATSAGCEQVHLPYGPDHPLGALLRRLTATVTLSSSADGGHLIRVINLKSTLRKMASEFSSRIAASPTAGRDGALTLKTPHQSATLVIRRGSVSVAETPPPGADALRGGYDIARLIVGADDPGAVIEAGGLTCTRGARAWADVLFPRLRQQHLRADSY